MIDSGQRALADTVFQREETAEREPGPCESWKKRGVRPLSRTCAA